MEIRLGLVSLQGAGGLLTFSVISSYRNMTSDVHRSLCRSPNIRILIRVNHLGEQWNTHDLDGACYIGNTYNILEYIEYFIYKEPT